MEDAELRTSLQLLMNRTQVMESILGNMSLFQRTDHQRLLKVESMLAFQMERQPMEQTAKPTVDQARQLSTMGLPAWQEVKRATNSYEVWKEGFDLKMDKKGVTDEKA